MMKFEVVRLWLVCFHRGLKGLFVSRWSVLLLDVCFLLLALLVVVDGTTTGQLLMRRVVLFFHSSSCSVVLPSLSG